MKIVRYVTLEAISGPSTQARAKYLPKKHYKFKQILTSSTVADKQEKARRILLVVAVVLPCLGSGTHTQTAQKKKGLFFSKTN